MPYAAAGHRILRIARALYGDDTARVIFEPLVADFERESSTSGSSRVLLRLRWLAAIAQTLVWCAPRALAVRMPKLLLLDVIGCAITFPLIALMLQWREIWSQAGFFGWRLVAALSFTVIPIVWRFRVAAIPEHQARGLTRSYVLLLCAIVLGLGYEEWPTRGAQALGILWLALVGWRLGDPNRPQYFSAVPAFIVRIAIVSGCLTMASLPVTLALDVDFQSPYWEQQQILMFFMAWVTGITLKKRFNGFTSIGP